MLIHHNLTFFYENFVVIGYFSYINLIANFMNFSQLLILIAVATFFSVQVCYSQSKVSGTVVDGSDNGKLEKAVIALLNPKDSILQKFVRTKENGSFVIPSLDSGTYKLIVSFPQYADYNRDITVSNIPLVLETIKLSKASVLIEEVAVTGKLPVVINGDTIEYNADSFKVDKDAKVEDLLKVLPGISVDANGKITAQGKVVKKVLLDGEEFFGDDPSLITKNIRSDMVSKVQVYEKKSDLTNQTGVDDGQRDQTIDIKLKADKKKGMFGQIMGGAGTNEYYTGKAMVNKFNGGQKISAYGIAANDGLVSLGFEDGQKYGMDGGTSMTMMDGGGIMITSGNSLDDSDSWSGQYNGSGVPRALNMGASFSDKSKDDKHKINVNFKRNQMDVDNKSFYNAQDNYPGRAILDNAESLTGRETKSNIANVRYDWKMDSLTNMIFKVGYQKVDRNNTEDKMTNQRQLDQTLINETFSKSISDAMDENVNADILLTRKFRKDRRSLSLNANVQSSDRDSKSKYTSLMKFANNNDETIDQQKSDGYNSLNFNTSLNYSEPLTKKLTALLGYSFTSADADNLNQSFDFNPATGLYDILDQSLLNDFEVITLKNALTTGLNYKDDKFTINLSNRISFDDNSRNYNNLNTNLHRNQTSLFPSMNLSYKISKSKNLRFNYNGRTIQPSLTQIEPLKQNYNPIVVFLDNENLKSSFSHSINVSYDAYKALQDKNLFIYSYFSQSINPIAQKVRYFASTGKREISNVNMDNTEWQGRLGGQYSMPLIKKMGVNFTMGISGNFNTDYSFLMSDNTNDVINKLFQYSVNPELGLRRSKANKLDFYISLSPGYQVINSSVQENLNSDVFTFNSNGDFTYYLGKDFKVNLEINQMYKGATSTLTSFSRFQMNGYVSKKFLKDKSLEAQVFVNDIFNRNNGLQRYQYGYSVIQTSNDVLKRFGMFKLIYNFTTMKGGK